MLLNWILTVLTFFLILVNVPFFPNTLNIIAAVFNSMCLLIQVWLLVQSYEYKNE